MFWSYATILTGFWVIHMIYCLSIEDMSGHCYMSEMDAKTLFFEARALEKEGKMEDALQKYEEAIAIEDTFDKAWFYKFKIHYQLGQLDEATHCAQKAVDLEPKWVKFIRDMEKRHHPQHDAIHLRIPEPEMKPEPKSTRKSKREPSIDPKLMQAMIREHDTTLDGKQELNGSGYIVNQIGILTRELDGLGPQRIVDPDSWEEWVIERKGSEIITLSHKKATRIGPKPLITSFRVAGIDGFVDLTSVEYRLFQALSKTVESRRHTRKFTDMARSKDFQKFLDSEDPDSEPD
jgi:hypothetical protein